MILHPKTDISTRKVTEVDFGNPYTGFPFPFFERGGNGPPLRGGIRVPRGGNGA